MRSRDAFKIYPGTNLIMGLFMSCADCTFLESNDTQNVCVRFPPTPAMVMTKGALGQPVPTIIAMRPQVQLEWDCGEWEAVGEADDKPETSTKQGVIIQ